jgi:hypothetical protein
LLLIAKGANVNARGFDGMTPLHVASKYGFPNVVPFLIANGADLDARDELGWNSLVYAIVCCSQEGTQIVQLLLRAGANYDLVSAAARGDLKRVREIFDEDPNTLTRISTADLKDMLCLGARDRPKEYGGVGNIEDRIEIIKTLFEKGMLIESKEIRNIAENYSNDKKLSAFLLHHLGQTDVPGP